MAICRQRQTADSQTSQGMPIPESRDSRAAATYMSSGEMERSRVLGGMLLVRAPQEKEVDMAEALEGGRNVACG
jgi:hypothetical protein